MIRSIDVDPTLAVTSDKSDVPSHGAVTIPYTVPSAALNPSCVVNISKAVLVGVEFDNVTTYLAVLNFVLSNVFYLSRTPYER